MAYAFSKNLSFKFVGSIFYLIPYSLHLLLVLDFMQTSLNASTYQKLEPNRYGLFSLFISVPFVIKCVGIKKDLF